MNWAQVAYSLDESSDQFQKHAEQLDNDGIMANDVLRERIVADILAALAEALRQGAS